MACHQGMYEWQALQETVDDLAGKISVKKRDNESIFRFQKETVKKNEDQISELRLTVKDAHQDLAKMINMDHKVIQSALQPKRETQLQCRRFKAHEALRELNEDVCVEGKKLNHFIHQKKCRLRRLQDLRLHYRDYKLLEKSNFETEDQKRVRLLMTKLDKMIMKRNTASFIQSTYLKTLSKLNKDGLTTHKELDGTESSNVKSTAELAELVEIHKTAKLGQEGSRAKRMALEKEVYHCKQVRDKTIVETRKRAKESAEMPEFGGNTRANDILNVGSHKTKKSCDTRPSVQLENLLPVIKMFAEVTNTVTAKELPKAYEKQIEYFTSLSEQAQKQDEQLKERLIKLASVREKLAEAKFTQAAANKELKKQIDEINENLKTTSSTIEEQQYTQNRLQNAMVGVNDAIQGLAEMLIPTKVEGASFETGGLVSSDLSIAQQVQVINDKLQAIQAAIISADIKQEEKKEEEISEDEITQEEVQEALLDTKTKCQEGVRILVLAEEDVTSTDNFLIDDMNENEYFITRDDIKKYGSAAQKLKLKGKRR